MFHEHNETKLDVVDKGRQDACNIGSVKIEQRKKMGRKKERNAE
jgi:hypothetical protein